MLYFSTAISIKNDNHIAIRIQIQSVGIFGVKVSGIVRGDKSAPDRGVVARAEAVKPGVLVVVVTAVSDRVYGRNAVCVERDGAVAICIVCIAANLGAVCVVNGNDVTPQVALEVVCAKHITENRPLLHWSIDYFYNTNLRP